MNVSGDFMSLQDLAIKALEAVSKELDPLVKNYGFDVKLRSSDAQVYTEVMGYEKGRYEIQITACMHPHDYPNELLVRYIEKEPGNWKYASLEELLKLWKDGSKVTNSVFPITTPDQLDESCKRLVKVMEIILSNKLYKLIPQTTANISSYVKR